jgi:hypothetical protein
MLLTKAKFKRPKPDPVPCEGCDRPVQSGRRCPACRVRKCRGALIDGEACRVCGIDQPRMLRWHRFTDDTVALCGSHDALAGRQAITVAAFLAEASAYPLRRAG